MEKLKNIDITNANEYQFATIVTNKGDINLKLYPSEAPITVSNFANLANEGFYDNLSFHRVIPSFVIQGGCPYGNGMGGPGYAIKCECDKNTHEHEKGTISMAHAGKDTGGSQFFICLEKQPHLDKVHTIFGDINDEESFEVIDNIRMDDTIKTIKIFKEK